jgi:hypothetical protein
MDAKKILETVADVGSWKGDVYKLAYAIADIQKETDATIAENGGSVEIATAIRES